MAALAARIDRVRVPVLLYHHVKPLRPSDNAIERGLTISPAQFRQEIAFLARRRYRVLTAAQVVAALHSGRRLPSRPVVLSFDDGYRDNATTVIPVLRRYRMRATFFLAAGLVGRARYVTWRQVRSMARMGMDIEAQTLTHPDLTRVPPAQARREIAGSRARLQARVRRPVRLFAYPYGSYNRFIVRVVRQAGFEAAFTTRLGWWLSRRAMLRLPRVYVDNDDTLPIFAGRLRADPAILARDPT